MNEVKGSLMRDFGYNSDTQGNITGERAPL
jgi:hypothetical protein